jgi:hypothetical protein
MEKNIIAFLFMVLIAISTAAIINTCEQKQSTVSVLDSTSIINYRFDDGQIASVHLAELFDYMWEKRWHSIMLAEEGRTND